MRKITLGLLLGAALAAATSPAWARDRLGVMKSFHGAHRVLVLDDGTQYLVAGDAAVPMFRPGDKVRFATEEIDGREVITWMGLVE